MNIWYDSIDILHSRSFVPTTALFFYLQPQIVHGHRYILLDACLETIIDSSRSLVPASPPHPLHPQAVRRHLRDPPLLTAHNACPVPSSFVTPIFVLTTGSAGTASPAPVPPPLGSTTEGLPAVLVLRVGSIGTASPTPVPPPLGSTTLGPEADAAGCDVGGVVVDVWLVPRACASIGRKTD